MSAERFSFHRGILPGVELVEADSACAFARHTHDRFGIGLIETGAQRSASGRGPVEAGPGNVITVNPGEVHDGIPIGDHGRRWAMLYVEPDALAQFRTGLTGRQDTAPDFEHPVWPVSPLPVLLRAAVATLKAPQACAMAAETALLRTLAATTPGIMPGRVPEPGAIARVRRRIDDDPATPVNLLGLASEAGLTRLGLLRAFARATGLPPHAYIMQRRVQMARRLIVAGTPLAETAALAGFADQSHMNRLFRRYLGHTPGACAPPAHRAS